MNYYIRYSQNIKEDLERGYSFHHPTNDRMTIHRLLVEYGDDNEAEDYHPTHCLHIVIDNVYVPVEVEGRDPRWRWDYDDSDDDDYEFCFALAGLCCNYIASEKQAVEMDFEDFEHVFTPEDAYGNVMHLLIGDDAGECFDGDLCKNASLICSIEYEDYDKTLFYLYSQMKAYNSLQNKNIDEKLFERMLEQI